MKVSWSSQWSNFSSSNNTIKIEILFIERFMIKKNLDKHKRYHAGEPIFSCELCEALFTNRFALNNYKLYFCWYFELLVIQLSIYVIIIEMILKKSVINKKLHCTFKHNNILTSLHVCFILPSSTFLIFKYSYPTTISI